MKYSNRAFTYSDSSLQLQQNDLHFNFFQLTGSRVYLVNETYDYLIMACQYYHFGGIHYAPSSHSTIYIVSGSAPRFTVEPENRVVVAQRNGMNVRQSFPCGFEGTDVTVTWYRNNLELPATDTRTIHPNGTLEITAIVDDADASIDGVDYYCVLSNEVGSVRSRTARIQLACKCALVWEALFEINNDTSLYCSNNHLCN